MATQTEGSIGLRWKHHHKTTFPAVALPWGIRGCRLAAHLWGQPSSRKVRLLSLLFAQRLRPLRLGSPACWEMWHSLQTGENGNLPLELARLQGR